MTKIFKTYSEFLGRENKNDNGVSPEFAKENPEFAKENMTNEGCWDCSGCSGCAGCSGCYDCSGCYRCSRCSGCSDKNEKSKSWFGAPKIPSIHQRLLAAIQEKGCKLDMSNWHTCETTHCRAGWIVAMAGEEGKKFEAASSTIFAAMQIYKSSSPIRVSPVRFFEAHDIALADIQRCANEEVKLQPAN